MDPISLRSQLGLIFIFIVSHGIGMFVNVTVTGAVVNLNYAFNKPATQSSTNEDRVASLAVDGDTRADVAFGKCAQTSKSEASTWWMVDVQESLTIMSIRFVSRADECCPDNLSDLDVEVSREHPSTLPGFPGRTNARVCVRILYESIQGGIPTTFACYQPVAGRYIRVVRNNTKYPQFLTICEFEAYPYIENNVTTYSPSENNLALNKPATQSSTLLHLGKYYAASKAVDGNLDGDFASYSCTRTVSDRQALMKHWWMVDLETAFSINRVRIATRINWVLHFLRDFAIEVSEQDPKTLVGFPGRTDSPVCALQFDILPYPDPVTLTCGQPVTGRYVRIVMTGNQLGLCEVEVFESSKVEQWRFVYVTGNEGIDLGGAANQNSPAVKRLLTKCARRRMRDSRFVDVKPYFHVDLSSGACQLYQLLPDSLDESSSANIWAVYELEVESVGKNKRLD